MFDRREFLSVTGAAGAALLVRPALAGAAASGVAANVAHYLTPLVERNDYSGFVLLERGGQTLISRGFGFADPATRTPHTADTRYATASVGKMFTRAAVLELEKVGKLRRADALAKYLPAFPSAATITIQNLVDHQSGLARDLPPDTGLLRPRTIDELIAIISKQPIEAKPGERTAYSNNGYRILAKVIEITGGGDFDSLIRELVFEPRRMRGSVPNLKGAPIARVAAGHWPGPGWGTRQRALAFDMSNARGAGSFLVTPADMLAFLKTLPLEPSDLADAATKDPDGKPKPRSIGHDGFGDGYANLTYAYPDEKAYLVSLSNMQSGAFMPMHGDMRRLLFGEVVGSPALPETTTGQAGIDWQRYIGDYDLRPGNPLRIRRNGDLLMVDGGEGGHPLVPLGGDRFFMRLRYAAMTFEGPPGPAGLLRWAEGSGEFALKRIG